MSEKMKQMIRKGITHVPTGRKWETPGYPHSDKLEKEYDGWMTRVMNGETTSFSIFTMLHGNSCRVTAFNSNILKDCVVEVEIYEERDE